jgi:hypothetical protein
MAERIQLTDDGELKTFTDFSSANTLQDLLKTQKQIKEAQVAKENAFLDLMKQWESKKSEPGMAKEFCTFGRGKDRAVICTNPFIEEYRSITFYADLSYLALTKKGFYVFYFQNVMGTSRIFDYASNPFTLANPRHEGWLNITPGEKLSVFHGLMRNQQPIDGGLRLTKLNTSSEPKLRVVCKYAANNNAVKSEYRYDFESRQIDINKASELFNGIQDRVKDVCDKKAEELNSRLQGQQNEINSLNVLFRAENKKKRD